MDRPTRLVLVASGVLFLTAAGLATARCLLLGSELSGMVRGARWRVKIRLTGYAKNPTAYTKLFLPQKSDAQQITSEEFKDLGVMHRLVTEGDEKKGEERNRLIEWCNAGSLGSKEMQVSFIAQTQPGKPPSQPMKKNRDANLQLNLKATDRIQSLDPEIQRTARELAGSLHDVNDKADALYQFCAFRIGHDFVPGVGDALSCLTNGWSDCGGKSRLMVALCRACGIPARLVGGIILNEGVKRDTHVWAEAWLNEQWVPFCPLNRYRRIMPPDYLILYRGDRPLIRHRYVDSFVYDFELHKIAAFVSEDAQSSNRWRQVAAAASLGRLSPNGQWAVRFLLLIPLGALVICILRNIVGLPTLGTFAPVLISLGVHLAPLKWGVLTVLTFIGVGLVVRWMVDRFKLLLVPRLSVMLTSVIIGMIAFVVITDQFETEMGAFVGLLPVVILTMSIERSWLLEIEDGFLNMFKHLLGTICSVILVCLVFRVKVLDHALFVMPELLLAVIALMLLIGRYSGFRLNEVLRFRALANAQVQSR